VSDIPPGWYIDPADRQTQRFWDGEGWIGDPIPAGVEPPVGPPPVAAAPGVPMTSVTSAPATAAPGDLDPGLPPVAFPPTGPQPRPPSGSPTGPQAGIPPWAYGYPPDGTVPRPHGLALAGVGARLVARLVDITAVLALCAVANAWFAYRWWQLFAPFMRDLTEYERNGGTAPQAPSQISTLVLMMCAVTAAVWLAYELPSSATSGQTLGKKLLGIKIVRIESDGRLGYGRAFRRWSRMGMPIMLWSFCGIGFLLQFIDCVFIPFDRPLHQALHDKSAGTVVVSVPRSARRGATTVVAGSRGEHHADPP
jgi:uncharacterized RDD family membrane protein YckC